MKIVLRTKNPQGKIVIRYSIEGSHPKWLNLLYYSRALRYFSIKMLKFVAQFRKEL